ncbi:MAG: hypothetical protein A4E50_01317 [Methanosaeta sp. PtaB.Bin087]|nr:MAG: hypothetical protein A4E50_01317 [Methanosaeta sp. PtaB.Bin087]
MLKLHPTASLVTLWSLPLYAGAGAQVREFLKMLDLSSGEGLLRRCNAICDWYGEVILNRKHFIKRTAKRERERCERHEREDAALPSQAIGACLGTLSVSAPGSTGAQRRGLTS